MIHNIPIYKAEISVAGLVEKIAQLNSVAYVSPLEPATLDIQQKIVESVVNKPLQDNSLLSQNAKVMAKLANASQNDSDLYFTKSIFVTTSWNKNDDVFHPKHTWIARHTPSHKPTNLEHDENQLVGHIVDCWAIDVDGNLISDNSSVDDLPDKYHLVTGAVIYKNWETDTLKERTANLISEIESGKKFVSMEVLFTDFDYAIQTPDGQSRVQARNEETAWMTKHLKAYGGTGEYQDYKIGRLLKNMTFCGKGYVNKPANPESVIFSANNNFSFTAASNEFPLLQEKMENGVELLEGNDKVIEISKGENNMADEIYKDQANRLEKVVADLETKLAEANDKLAKSNIEKYTAQIEELTKIVEDQKKSMADITNSLKDTEDKLTDALKSIDTEKETKAKLETQLQEIKLAELKANRVSTLVDGGFDKETAVTKVDVFANLSDEQFSVVATELITAVKTVKTQAVGNESSDIEETETENEADEEKDSANASEKVLEDTEKEEQTDMSVAGDEEDSKEKLRKELSEAIARSLGHKLNNEGDE